MNNNISKNLKSHYEKCFNKFGATNEGVDWGQDISKMFLRYDKMKELFTNDKSENISILDVGCGYGGFYSYLKENTNKEVTYSGIDLVEDMILWAKNNINTANEFICDDFINYNFEKKYDYIICNGILTQKLEASNKEMDLYASKIIKKMFEICNKGIAFNIMTTKVNYFSNNLYYKSPVEMLSFCLNELSDTVKIDHSYLYEYTLYVYKENK